MGREDFSFDKRAPIAIFDSGVGSYSVLKKLREFLPQESFVYLADRASFPYGEKSREELKKIIERTIVWLEENFEPKLIVVASNTPSIAVLDSISTERGTPTLGVFPPLREAESKSESQNIAILATRGAVVSSELDDFVAQQDLLPATSVIKVDASALVALVEPGTFLREQEKTETTIRATLDPALAENPHIDVMTLSSTHLPFLIGYLEKIYPHIVFLDPASRVAFETKALLEAHSALAEGIGEVKVFASEDASRGLTIEDLQKTLAVLGLRTEVEPAVIT